MFDFLKRKTISEGAPKTIQEAGIALAKTPEKVRMDALSMDEDRRPEDELKYYRNAYYNVPLVAGMINIKTDQTVQDFYFTGPNAAQLMNFADKVNLKRKFSRICKLCYIFGDSFVEVIKNKKGKVVDLKVIDPQYMRMYTSPTGDVVGYGQIIDNKKLVLFGTTGDSQADAAFKRIVKDAERIAHFKFNPLESGNYGTSMIRPMLPLLDTKLDMEIDLKVIVRRYSAPIIHAKTGNDQLPATDNDLTNVASEIDDLRADNEIVTSHLVDLKVLEFNNKGVDLKTPFEYVDRQIISASQVPPLLLGYSAGIDRATAEVQLRNFWGHIRAKQQELKVDFEDQIIVKHGLGTPKSKLVWKFADPREKDVEVSQVIDLSNSGLITKQKGNDVLADMIDPRLAEDLPDPMDFMGGEEDNSEGDKKEDNIPKHENPNDPTKSTRIKKGKRVTKTDFRSPMEKTEKK